MADRELNSITFPGLPDRYVVSPGSKVDKRTGSGLEAYTHDGSTQGGKSVTETPTSGAIPLYGTGGVLKAGAPTADNDVARKAEIDAVKGNIDAITITDTASGAIASFPDGADSLPVKSLVCEINPLQDLHGYDNPWPAGGGKNKASPLELGSVSESSTQGSTYSEMQINSTSRARTAVLIPVNEQQYTVSLDFTTYRVAVASFDENQQYLGKTNGWRGWSTEAFTQGGTGRFYVALIIKRVDEANLTDSDLTNCKLQLEIGSSATSYAPYENVCPISGFTGLTLPRTGKNLYNKSAGRYIDVTFRAGTTIYAAENLGSGFGLYFAHADGSASEVLNMPANGNMVSITLTKDAYRAAISESAYNSLLTSGKNMMVSFSPFDSIEPFGTTYTQTFVDGQGNTLTVYGAEDEIISGELIVDRFMAEPDENVAASVSSSTDTTVVFQLQMSLNNYPNSAHPHADAISNRFSTEIPSGTPGRMVVNTAQMYIVIAKSELSTYDAQGLKAWLQNHPTQILYKLAEPVTYQLDPIIVQTLRGQNNIWHSDNGNTTVEYCADTKLYLEKLTQPTEDDMIANSAIESGKYFFVGNRLFLSTAAIANGATLTPGTNCVETNLAEALNTLNS